MIQKLIPILILILCVALLPEAPAISPAPDGCYPNFTTVEGCKALNSLTTGAGNTAVGWYSLFATSTGSFNTAVGAGALDLNTADNNTAVGVAALLLNTTGTLNTAIGSSALLNNTADQNTATGAGALSSNTIGDSNTAIGVAALINNTTGSSNTANGLGALEQNSTGASNTATGFQALFSNAAGTGNTADGNNALSNSTGSNNTALGAGAGGGVTTANNVICIGASGADVSNSCFIGHIRGVTTANAAIPVLIDTVGQLGTMSSSKRFKKEIQPIDKASEAILALNPVRFHYKSDNTNTPQFGLIAEEVADVNPDLVVRDENGEIYTVRYDAVNAMLLNEFLKEHRKVEAQERRLGGQEVAITELKLTIAQQQKAMETVTAQLNEQAAQIQKVSVQIGARNVASRMVVNTP